MKYLSLLILTGLCLGVQAQNRNNLRPASATTRPNYHSGPSTVQSSPTPSAPAARTQVFRDGSGRVTGTATTQTSSTGSEVTTYQTGSGRPVVSSTEFINASGTGTTVQKNVYSNTSRNSVNPNPPVLTANPPIKKVKAAKEVKPQEQPVQAEAKTPQQPKKTQPVKEKTESSKTDKAEPNKSNSPVQPNHKS